MMRIPGQSFFRDLKADINSGIKELNQAAADGEAERQARGDFKDALGTRDYAESIRNLSEILNRMDSPGIQRLQAPVELKEIYKEPAPLIDDTEGMEDDFAYWFIRTDGDNVKISKADFDDLPDDDGYEADIEENFDEIDNPISLYEKAYENTPASAEEMSLGEFLERTKEGKFDIIPVLYNLNYSAKNAFTPENIEKIVVSNPDKGDQIILFTKDGKRALLDFLTGRRMVKEPDGSLSLIDDDGYTYHENIRYNYSRKK